VTAERTLINYTTSDGRFHIVCTTAWFWSLDMLTGAVTTLPLSQAPKAVQRAMELQNENVLLGAPPKRPGSPGPDVR
jgi:hypothetical protein